MTKKVVTTSRRHRPAGFAGFNFTTDHMRAAPGVLGEYRTKAWSAFENLPYPTTKDEPWRRTDIRGLDGAVRIPHDGAYEDLQPVPERRCRESLWW